MLLHKSLLHTVLLFPSLPPHTNPETHTVQCTVYTMQYTVHNVLSVIQCIWYNVHCALYSVHCTVDIRKCNAAPKHFTRSSKIITQQTRSVYHWSFMCFILMTFFTYVSVRNTLRPFTPLPPFACPTITAGT